MYRRRRIRTLNNIAEGCLAAAIIFLAAVTFATIITAIMGR
jgi:hypothetical protein